MKLQYKVFNYELWRNKADGTYYTRFNGTTVEVTREVYYELMRHENADRYAEQSDKARICQLRDDTTWHMVRDISDEIADKIELEELLSCYAGIDRIIILHYLTREMSAREIEQEYKIPHSTVIWRGKKLMVELKEILEKLVKNGL